MPLLGESTPEWQREYAHATEIKAFKQMLKDKDARISRLIERGDELAESVEVMRAQADCWVGPRVVTALQAWRDINHEAGEGRG